MSGTSDGAAIGGGGPSALRLGRAEAGALAAGAFIGLVTAAWWALALWPAPDAPPEWLVRARWVCFNAEPGGLPGPSGWLLLIGQPIGMWAALMAIYGRHVVSGARKLSATASGRALWAVCAAALVVGLGAALVRVGNAMDARRVVLPGDTMPPDTYPRLDRPAPELGLQDQLGGQLALADLRGRPALVTFAFGNCHTVCPAVVRQTLDAQSRVRARAEAGEIPASSVPRVVIVSLDPWRDTPSRLAHLADHWEVGDDAWVLTGDVEGVESVLTDWNVARKRDPSTGDIIHPPLVYVLDADGRIAYATTGGVDAMVELVGRV